MADFKIYIFTKIAINNTSWKSIEINNSVIHGISTNFNCSKNIFGM